MKNKKPISSIIVLLSILSLILVAIHTSAATNNPPIITMFSGTPIGSKNEELSYYAVATDPDGDNIKYTFGWDDGSENTTEFMANGTDYNITHIFTTAGIYNIWVEAIDYYNTTSARSNLTVLIDTAIIDDSINDVNGYLTDNNGDGVYDNFLNNKDGTKSSVTKEGNYYFIDLDKDGTPDYKYDPSTGSSEIINNNTTIINDNTTNGNSNNKPSQGNNNTIYYIIGIFIIIMILLLFFLAIRKR